MGLGALFEIEETGMEKPIRILQVLGRLDRGGAETMLMNLYRCMDRTQIQFDFVIHTTDVCDYTEEVERLGGKIYSMEPFRASTAAGYCRQWRSFFREHREYKIIHGHMRSTASLYLKEAKKAGLVTLAHSHNTSSGRGISAVVKNLLQYPLRYQADYLLACSRLAGEWLYGKRACAGNNFRLLLNGIETKQFAFNEEIREKKRKEMQVGEDNIVFLHVGRLEEQKNHSFLICIMQELVKQEEKAVLWLCGMGPLETEIRTLVKEAGIASKVFFLGVREDVSGLMQAADVFLFPSLFEGLPVTVVEAQASGLPVIMSDTITKEVILTELVEAYPLAMEVGLWAEKALAAVKRVDAGRENYAEQIGKKGYDVKKNAGELSAFYESLYEDKA